MAQVPAVESLLQPAAKKAVENSDSKNKYLVPFILITCLFFLWGMAHNLDSILVPHLKKGMRVE